MLDAQRQPLNEICGSRWHVIRDDRTGVKREAAPPKFWQGVPHISAEAALGGWFPSILFYLEGRFILYKGAQSKVVNFPRKPSFLT